MHIIIKDHDEGANNSIGKYFFLGVDRISPIFITQTLRRSPNLQISRFLMERRLQEVGT